jgi:ParB-like chromosome segregation protein Spo0J
MSWRDHIKVHPAADLFPMMSEAELKELAESIKKNGMKVPVVIQRGHDRDGRNAGEQCQRSSI